MLPEVSDVAVIGAGIIGLATARQLLTTRRRSLVVLEAEATVANHQTGRNSGVIHSGLYYRPGSRKALTCVAGRRRLIAYLKERGLAYEICGKCVVATRVEDEPMLAQLAERGRANGLSGVRKLSAAELSEHEPNVRAVAGLWVPQTGITDYRLVAQSLAHDIATDGGRVVTGARLLAVRSERSEWILETTAGVTRAEMVVNCAGLQSDRVARLCGVRPAVRIIPFRGEYYRLTSTSAALVNGLIYPVPDRRYPFLGVHLTRRISGEIECGPNAVLALRREGYSRTEFSVRDTAEMLVDPAFWRLAAAHWRTGLDEQIRSLSKAKFVQSLQQLVPELRPEHFEPHGSGVRAQAVADDGTLLDDFQIERAPGQIHVLNAPSPAATASLEIAAVIGRMVDSASKSGGEWS